VKHILIYYQLYRPRCYAPFMCLEHPHPSILYTTRVVLLGVGSRREKEMEKRAFWGNLDRARAGGWGGYIH